MTVCPPAALTTTSLCGSRSMPERSTLLPRSGLRVSPSACKCCSRSNPLPSRKRRRRLRILSVTSLPLSLCARAPTPSSRSEPRHLAPVRGSCHGLLWLIARTIGLLGRRVRRQTGGQSRRGCASAEHPGTALGGALGCRSNGVHRIGLRFTLVVRSSR